MFTSVDLINSNNDEFDGVARRTVVHSESGFDFRIYSFLLLLILKSKKETQLLSEAVVFFVLTVR
jgi:hypothetical protein